ncbi:MAG: hypothetical protein OXE97_09680 [Gammaproteobacteria bacterium]|nr:hypothetical protein [Gammaproteobacteria bacterium]MCY4283503.1 hypothetical protein [Gammaproteobacteria bacterium]
MSQESITVLGVGVALAGLILVQGNHNTRGLADVLAEIADVRTEIADVRNELVDVRARIAAVSERLARVETRLAIPAANDTSVAAATLPVD